MKENPWHHPSEKPKIGQMILGMFGHDGCRTAEWQGRSWRLHLTGGMHCDRPEADCIGWTEIPEQPPELPKCGATRFRASPELAAHGTMSLIVACQLPWDHPGEHEYTLRWE